MTPLEQMAKALFEHDSVFRWDQCPTFQASVIGAMRAAVLALAEADISKEMIAVGFEDNAQGFEDGFARLLRAIAEGNT